MTGRSRFRTRLAVLGTLCGVVLAVEAGTTAAPAATRTTEAALTSAVAAPTTRSGAWRALPRSPLPAFMDPVAVWTGTDVLVYGTSYAGDTPVSRLAAYRPASRSWRMLARPPARGNVEGVTKGVWTGRELLLWGGGIRARYDPRLDRWRVLPPTVPTPGQSVGAGGQVAVWTGRELIVWGGGCCGGSERGGSAYDPRTNRWRPLPLSPLSARSAAGAWTGHELVIAGGASGEGGTFRDAAAYDPARNRWRRLPPMPTARAYATALWDGTEVLFLSGTGRGAAPLRTSAAYDPRTGRWRTLPPAAFDRVEGVAVWTGSEVLVWGGRHQVVDGWARLPYGERWNPRTGVWRRLPTAPLHGRARPAGVWTGRSLFVWGGYQVEGSHVYRDGAEFRP